MRKRLISCLFILLLVLSCTMMSSAASSEAITAANELHEMGLFNGVETDKSGAPNFDLDRTPTRYEAVTMLVRLLGKEEEAKARVWDTPFQDVAAWAKPYVAYAYVKGLTTGVGTNSYGGDLPVAASQYLTFVLRALQYKSGVDFTWNQAWVLSDAIGLTNGDYNASTTLFTRGDVAVISRNALNCKLKGSDVRLSDIIPSSELNNSKEIHAYREFPDVPDYAYYFSDHVKETVAFKNGYIHKLKAPYDECQLGYIRLASGFGFVSANNNALDLHKTELGQGKTLWENRIAQTETGRAIFIGVLDVKDDEWVYITVDTPPQDDMIAYIQEAIGASTKVSRNALAEIGDILADYGDMEQEVLTACQKAMRSSGTTAAVYAEFAMQYNATMAAAAYKGVEICNQYSELYDLKLEMINLWISANALTGYTITSQNAYSYATLVVNVSSEILGYYRSATEQYQKAGNMYL